MKDLAELKKTLLISYSMSELRKEITLGKVRVIVSLKRSLEKVFIGIEKGYRGSKCLARRDLSHYLTMFGVIGQMPI